MITDLDCANYCSACYSAPAQFDAIFSGESTENVWVGIKYLPDCCVIAFRGSVCFLDWQRDFSSIMISDPDIGGVEQGFMQGMREVFDVLKPILLSNKNIIVTGHSLGAARALIFAGLMNVYGLKPVKVVTFGSPRPGAERLKFILSGTTVISYRNRHDPVTNVPIDIPGMPYVHPSDLIQVDMPPRLPDIWGLLADHHISLYTDAMRLAQASSER